MPGGMNAPGHWLDAAGLPAAARSGTAWRVLDADFDGGQHFLDCCRFWTAMAQRGQSLHYVVIAQVLPALSDLAAQMEPQLATSLLPDLESQWFGLLPGFSRLSLQQGRILLTLCLGGERAMLRAQQCEFDAVFLPARPAPTWDRWMLGALTRLCHRGSCAVLAQADPAWRALLEQSGFVLNRSPAPHSSMVARFDPQWRVTRTRRNWPAVASANPSCLVIGAGLAGASVAAALARRGWPVTVLDSAPGPATAASGLPVGLAVSHVSVDDSARSRLSRAGLRLTLHEARNHLRQGLDWQASGVLEQRTGTGANLPDTWGDAGKTWSRLAPERVTGQSWSQGLAAPANCLWHSHAAWIKPAALVAAWLGQPGVRFAGGHGVKQLRFEDGLWSAQTDDGQILGRASHVVLAAAAGCSALLAAACKHSAPTAVPVLQQVHGQLSWGMQTDQETDLLPPFPVNGSGSLVSNVPWDGGLAWFAGATYSRADWPQPSTTEAHVDNARRLRSLLPRAADIMEAGLAARCVQAWSGTRVTTADRLPLLGPVAEADGPNLWLCTGMGSRGLTLAPLCAQLLAAQLCGEPLPIEAQLLRVLQVYRGRNAGDAFRKSTGS